MSPNTPLTVPAGGAVITRAGAMAALFVVLERLDAGQLDALAAHARELAEGTAPVTSGALTPIDPESTPLAGMWNSILGFDENGKRRGRHG
jgi:hypothetical protein